MPESAPPSFDLSLSCDLCDRYFPPAEVVLRGKRNFCQTCATQRAAECLARLQAVGRKPRWPAIVLSALGLGLVGWGVVTVAKLSPARVSSFLQRQFAAKKANTPESVPPSPIAASGPALYSTFPIPPVAEAKETNTSWLGRIFPDRKHRSVEDAGRIHLLFVTRPGTDARMGLTSFVFATREAPDNTSAKLTTDVGKEMQTSFDEGLRYVRKRPRDWERNFSVRLSFEDKFTSKDGGSAGTGFTIAMLAAIHDIHLDPDVAVTGDLTVDGTVQPVGAVVEKLRGAIAGDCKVTLIPERNSRSIIDLALLDGTSPLWETQILAIRTIDQALNLARTDRPEAVQDALNRFRALRARLPSVVTPNYLQSPIVQTELKEVLRLAPNHLSASTLLKAAENQLPQELSLNRSVEEIIATSYLFVSQVVQPSESSEHPSGKSNGIATFPEREYNECLKALQRRTSILDRRSVELKTACIAYASALRSAFNYQLPDATVPRTRQQMNDLVRRESGFLRNTKEEVDETRSRLLLVLRKLDTDGAMMAELLKK